jgi:hypothetical protein
MYALGAVRSGFPSVVDRFVVLSSAYMTKAPHDLACLQPMGRTALMEQHLGGDWRIHFISEQLWAELTTDEKKLDFINEKLRLST